MCVSCVCVCVCVCVFVSHCIFLLPGIDTFKKVLLRHSASKEGVLRGQPLGQRKVHAMSKAVCKVGHPDCTGGRGSAQDW